MTEDCFFTSDGVEKHFRKHFNAGTLLHASDILSLFYTELTELFCLLFLTFY